MPTTHALDPRADRTAPFLAGGGDVGAAWRAGGGAETPLGPPAWWPAPLRAAMRRLLADASPAVLVWGPGQHCVCNDAWSRQRGGGGTPTAPASRSLVRPVADVFAAEGPSFADRLAALRQSAVLPDPTADPRYELTPIDDDGAEPARIGGVYVRAVGGAAPGAHTGLAAPPERWRQLFEQSPGLTCVLLGPDHVFAYCNPAYLRVIGHGDLEGRTVDEALPWAREHGYLALLDRVFATGEPYTARNARITLPGPDAAAARFFDFVYQPVREDDGRVSGILVLGSDVTEQRQAEAALERSEQRLRIAGQSASLGVYELDLDTRRLQWDAPMQALWGSPHEGSVTQDHWLLSIHPADRQGTLDAIERALDAGSDGRYDAEFRVVDALDGRTRWVLAHGQTVVEDGVPRRVIGTVQDVSERKQADARRDEFLATLGHELRNPLAPIGNALKVLQREVQPGGSAGHALAIVGRQYRHVVRLLDDLLDAVRLQHGRFALRKSRVTLLDVVEQAFETAHAQLEAGGNRVERRLPPSPVWLDADPIRLAQVISNLLINASKYSDAGSPIELVAELQDAGRRLHLAVRDRGIGIEPAFIERVFETFSQSQLALDRTQGGLGIGLALARGIVGLHGGRIEARSAGTGQGSEFVLELPVAPQRSEGASRDPRRSVAAAVQPLPETAGDTGADMRLARHRILIVEDNHDHAETLSVLLGLYGASVRWALDGLAALDAAEEQRPDTVLLDLGLPGINGYEVCKRLRARPWGRQARIFALTGWGQPADRQRTREAGFDQHLLKPVDFDHLLTVLAG